MQLTFCINSQCLCGIPTSPVVSSVLQTQNPESPTFSARSSRLHAQVAATASALECAGAARLAQVEAWGEAVGGSVAATSALEQVTSSLGAATAQFGEELAARAEAVGGDGRRWGLANREAEAALRGEAAQGEEQGVVLLKEGLARLEAARAAGRAELQQQVGAGASEAGRDGSVNLLRKRVPVFGRLDRRDMVLLFRQFIFGNWRERSLIWWLSRSSVRRTTNQTR